jgi:hypothetical protein
VAPFKFAGDTLLDKLIAKLSSGLEPSVDPTPSAGKVYSFATAPYNEFSPAQTGRFSAFKIIGVSDDLYVVAVLAGIWPDPPTLQQAAKCEILAERRFAHSGQLAVFGVNRQWWEANGLPSLAPLGIARISRLETKLATAVTSFAVGSRLSTLNAANWAAEGEWRWAHDRAALSAEADLQSVKAAERRAAIERRYRERLSKLTWDQLLSETPLSRWTREPPFPPAEFTAAARAKLRQACQDLRELGPKPRKAWVRKVLKDTVTWFNEADDANGGVIETEEREDICSALEELAFVAGQKSLVDEIDNWREW